MKCDSLRLDRLIKEVQILKDRQDILDRVNQYSRGVDRHDIAIILDAYHRDAIDEHGNTVNLAPDFPNWVNKIHDLDYSLHLHNITTHNCEVIGDVAHCESYVIFGLSSKDEKTVRLGGGRYLDRMERRVGVWKIAHRRTMIDWMIVGDNTLFNSPGFKSRGFPKGKTNREDDSYDRPLGLSPKKS
jgi:SnoaL-like domain